MERDFGRGGFAGAAMVISVTFCRSVVALLVLAEVLCGQQAEFNARLKSRPVSPEELVRQFEAPALASYTLGAGDEISVAIWGRPELSGKHVIGPDGKITLPIAGVVKLADLDREAAQKAIEQTLAPYYSDLAVTLRVDRYTSYRVFVLGRVGNPGALQFESQPTLLDVLTRADSLPITGGEKAQPGRCAVIRSGGQIVWIDLGLLLNKGDLALNIRLARNDMVYLPDAADRMVYVLGAVQHPGVFQLTPDMTFIDAYTLAGGASEDATESRIQLVRSTTGAHQELRLKDVLRSPQERNFALEDGDIIYVPKRTMAKFGYVLQRIGALTGFAVVGAAATN